MAPHRAAFASPPAHPSLPSRRAAAQVKDDELAQVKDKMVREKDEKIQKLSSSVKELKQSLSLRDQELASMRKQLGSAHKAEEEAKKQRASADGQKQKEESLSKVEMAKLKGSIELACNEELKKLSESHEQVQTRPPAACRLGPPRPPARAACARAPRHAVAPARRARWWGRRIARWRSSRRS